MSAAASCPTLANRILPILLQGFSQERVARCPECGGFGLGEGVGSNRGRWRTVRLVQLVFPSREVEKLRPCRDRALDLFAILEHAERQPALFHGEELPIHRSWLLGPSECLMRSSADRRAVSGKQGGVYFPMDRAPLTKNTPC